MSTVKAVLYPTPVGGGGLGYRTALTVLILVTPRGPCSKGVVKVFSKSLGGGLTQIHNDVQPWAAGDYESMSVLPPCQEKTRKGVFISFCDF